MDGHQVLISDNVCSGACNDLVLFCFSLYINKIINKEVDNWDGVGDGKRTQKAEQMGMSR